MQTHGGVSRCFAELIHCLPDDVEAVVGASMCENVYMMPIEHLYRKAFSCKILYRTLRYKAQKTKLNEYLMDRDICIDLLKKGDFDVFHPTFFDDYFLPYLGDKPLVVTIHDMAMERYPEMFPLSGLEMRRKKELAQRADHIVAVSENTKKDVIELYGIPEDKITVIYHGAPKALSSYSLKDKPIEYPYILYVGSRWTYKNFVPFIEAVLPIMRARQNLNIVCTGTPFSADEMTLFRQHGIEDRVHQMFVSADELATLYVNAECFIYPSLYEGFGIPILEAWRCGCPVLLNNASCFPEIAKDGAMYFSLNEKENTLTECLRNFLTLQNEQKQALIDKGHKALNNYSWKESAQKLAEVYKMVCHKI
nr:glycosyltransferase family 1 protein [Bacteroides sp. Ga6A2]